MGLIESWWLSIEAEAGAAGSAMPSLSCRRSPLARCSRAVRDAVSIRVVNLSEIENYLGFYLTYVQAAFLPKELNSRALVNRANNSDGMYERGAEPVRQGDEPQA